MFIQMFEFHKFNIKKQQSLKAQFEDPENFI